MKRALQLWLACFIVTTILTDTAASQNMEDVVYLKNGSIIRGTVIEQVPGKSLKIKTRDGSVFVYTMDDVERITKEDAPAQMSSPTISGRMENKGADIGITAGYWFSGTVNIQGTDVDKDGGFLVRAFADAYLMPKLAFGGYFNFSPYSQSGVDITLFEFGASIKPRFFLGPDLAIKPGLNIGYRFTTSDIDAAEISALGINFSVEIQKSLGSVAVFGEIGFLSEPSGGNDIVEVTFAPIFYVGAGIAF